MSDRFLPRHDNVKAEISERTLEYDGFIKLYTCKVDYNHSTGDRRSVEREIHDHGHAICVLPVDRDRRVALLVRQLRIGPLANGDRDPMILEVAAGLVDPGETAEEAALREAREELGFDLNDLFHVTSFYASPGTLTEKIDAYLASYTLNDKIHAGGGLDAEDEDIIVEEIALDELGEAALQGNLRDAKTILLVQHLMLGEPELFF
ncbi:nudix-type nucleoside diphosphatase, YffH/AdpP family [Cohaesibacter sp. ES.047]|uniref:NUDIX domain-containing protein n=1 Tax=Cohaesibacter sp. ES.047 TaxID=1798205 RepID=UPI000BB87F9E|nr:NUDIX hydrolase [Cohaesibacter sp. ES.047]SNY91954.1 nudix-type nucleoside diphosphatase, YffH/AdpP family [Cohaesibacter sp. ES.047]